MSDITIWAWVVEDEGKEEIAILNHMGMPVMLVTSRESCLPLVRKAAEMYKKVPGSKPLKLIKTTGHVVVVESL